MRKGLFVYTIRHRLFHVQRNGERGRSLLLLNRTQGPDGHSRKPLRQTCSAPRCVEGTEAIVEAASRSMTLLCRVWQSKVHGTSLHILHTLSRRFKDGWSSANQHLSYQST